MLIGESNLSIPKQEYQISKNFFGCSCSTCTTVKCISFPPNSWLVCTWILVCMLLNVRLMFCFVFVYETSINISLYGWNYLCVQLHWHDIVFYGYILFLYTHLYCLVGCFEHDCLETFCFGVSYMHVFCIFVFALVQRNWACFTWKGALEICLLLPLLLHQFDKRKQEEQMLKLSMFAIFTRFTCSYLVHVLT